MRAVLFVVLYFSLSEGKIRDDNIHRRYIGAPYSDDWYSDEPYIIQSQPYSEYAYRSERRPVSDRTFIRSAVSGGPYARIPEYYTSPTYRRSTNYLEPYYIRGDPLLNRDTVSSFATPAVSGFSTDDDYIDPYYINPVRGGRFSQDTLSSFSATRGNGFSDTSIPRAGIIDTIDDTPTPLDETTIFSAGRRNGLSDTSIPRARIIDTIDDNPTPAIPLDETTIFSASRRNGLSDTSIPRPEIIDSVDDAPTRGIIPLDETTIFGADRRNGLSDIFIPNNEIYYNPLRDRRLRENTLNSLSATRGDGIAGISLPPELPLSDDIGSDNEPPVEDFSTGEVIPPVEEIPRAIAGSAAGIRTRRNDYIQSTWYRDSRRVSGNLIDIDYRSSPVWVGDVPATDDYPWYDSIPRYYERPVRSSLYTRHDDHHGPYAEPYLERYYSGLRGGRGIAYLDRGDIRRSIDRNGRNDRWKVDRYINIKTTKASSAKPDDGEKDSASLVDVRPIPLSSSSSSSSSTAFALRRHKAGG